MDLKKIIAMIPVRMRSTRYPGKPLADICGKTMVEHVWQRTKLNKKISSVYIVTCDKEIKEKAEQFGASVIMTSEKHVRCTDRVAEGCKKLVKNNSDFDIVLNIQGDEPLLQPAVLEFPIKLFNKEETNIVNLLEEIRNEEEINNTNTVKTVFDQNNTVLYYSRLPIPNGLRNNHYKQLGIYAFTKEMIFRYTKLKQTPLEIAESCDMLRFVENNIPIKIAISPFKTVGVDTPEDHEKVNKLMQKDKIFKKYKHK